MVLYLTILSFNVQKYALRAARYHRSDNIKTPRGLQARITGLLSRPSDHKPVGQQPSRRDVGVTACRVWTGHKRRNPDTSCHSNTSDILVWLNINGQPSKRTSAIIDISIGTTECRCHRRTQ